MSNNDSNAIRLLCEAARLSFHSPELLSDFLALVEEAEKLCSETPDFIFLTTLFKLGGFHNHKSAMTPPSKHGNSDGKRVYFMQAIGSGLIKIGCSTDQNVRLKQIGGVASEKLVLLGTIDGDHATEASLHCKFAHIRKHGEWFEPDASLLAFIASSTGGAK
jgi:hypothetical protein